MCISVNVFKHRFYFNSYSVVFVVETCNLQYANTSYSYHHTTVQEPISTMTKGDFIPIIKLALLLHSTNNWQYNVKYIIL